MLSEYLKAKTKRIASHWGKPDFGAMNQQNVVVAGESEAKTRPLFRQLVEEAIHRGDQVILCDPQEALTEDTLPFWRRARHRPILLQPDYIFTHTLNPLQLFPGYGPKEAADIATSAFRIHPSLSIYRRFHSLIWAGSYLLAAADQRYTLLELCRWFYQRAFRNVVAEEARDRYPPQETTASARAFALWSWLSNLDRERWTWELGKPIHELVQILYGRPYPCLLIGASRSTIDPRSVVERSFAISHSGFTADLITTWIGHHLKNERPPLFRSGSDLYLNAANCLHHMPLSELAKEARRLKMRLCMTVTPEDSWVGKPWAVIMDESDFMIPLPEEPEEVYMLGALAGDGTERNGGWTQDRTPKNQLMIDLRSLNRGQYLVWRGKGSKPAVGLVPDPVDDQFTIEAQRARDWILELEAREVGRVVDEIRRRNTELNRRFEEMALGMLEEWWAPFETKPRP